MDVTAKDVSVNKLLRQISDWHQAQRFAAQEQSASKYNSQGSR